MGQELPRNVDDLFTAIFIGVTTLLVIGKVRSVVDLTVLDLIFRVGWPVAFIVSGTMVGYFAVLAMGKRDTKGMIDDIRFRGD